MNYEQTNKLTIEQTNIQTNEHRESARCIAIEQMNYEQTNKLTFEQKNPVKTEIAFTQTKTQFIILAFS